MYVLIAYVSLLEQLNILKFSRALLIYVLHRFCLRQNFRIHGELKQSYMLILYDNGMRI